MPDQEFTVTVVLNEQPSAPGQVVVVGKGMTMAKFKKVAGRRLGIKARRVFSASGAEVLHVDEMGADDQLFVSQGEPFFQAGGAAGAAGGAAQQETLHVSVLGSGGVGKSAITLRFVRDFFVRDWDPTIEDAYRKTVDVDDKLYTLEILDTAGQDDFQSLRPQWMSEKDAYVFVYSMDSRKSFEELGPFIELHRQINESRPVPIILVANKSDLVARNPDVRAVSRDMGVARAQQIGAMYMETSAFTGDNVPEVFETLVRMVRRLAEPVRQSKGKCAVM